MCGCTRNTWKAHVVVSEGKEDGSEGSACRGGREGGRGGWGAREEERKKEGKRWMDGERGPLWFVVSM